MLKPQEKTIAILPCDLILKIFSDDCLGTGEHLIISLVCNLWTRLSSNNTVWQTFFSRKFLWSPALFYTHASVKESYRKQLALNISHEEKCKPDHQCSREPGLIEAIRAHNIPLVEALLNSGHGIFVSSEQPLDKFFDEFLHLLSESTNLPPILIRKIFENGIFVENMMRSEVDPFHILCLKGNQALLEKIFTMLGDDLLKLSRFCDCDGVDLFSHLLNYPYYGSPEPYADAQTGEEKTRLILVLEKFYSVLGKTRMRSLLTSPFFLCEGRHESFIHVLANHIECPDGNHHFLMVFSYLEKEDYWILLKEGSGYTDIPLLHLMRCLKSFKQVMMLLGDVVPEFLRHENSKGMNFLYILLFKEEFLHIHLLETEMGLGFMDLLVNHNDNMLKKMLDLEVTGSKNRIIKTLKLMNEYNCGDIIQKIYNCPEFTQILSKNCCLNKNDVDEILDVFNEYLEEAAFDCVLF